MADLKNPVLCVTAGRKISGINKPAVFVTAWLSESCLKSPRLFVSMVEGSPFFSLNCDTQNVAVEGFAIKADVLCKNTVSAKMNVDSSRKLTAAFKILGDSSVKIRRRGAVIPFDVQTDSLRNLQKKFSIFADVINTAKRGFSIYADSELRITSKKVQPFCINGDMAVSYQCCFFLFSDSCLKRPYNTTFIPANTEILPSPFVIPAQKPKSGMVSMKISLNELTLSDSFEMETTYPVDVLDAVSGQILDYKYSYVIGETDWQDMTITASGMYDVDRILYMPIKYSAGSKKHKAGYHAQKIAGALSKKLNIAIDDFTHSSTWVGNGQTYESIISSLFGWTSEIPHRQINVFLRAADNSINIIQRGHEAKITDISNTHHTRPHFHRELVRTMWSGRSTNGGGIAVVNNINVEPMTFSGTISFGDSSCSYVSGYLVTETSNGNRSTYSYVGGSETGMYLSKKNITHADGGHTDITYRYNTGASGVKVLGEEKEITYDKNGKLQSQRLTVHAPLGNGFYGTSVYVDDEYQGSSISTGSPSGVASRYMRNEESITLGGARYSSSNDSDDGNSFIEEANFPVEESEILKGLTRELKWLNRRIKETVTVDIYNYDHVLDFFEKIRLFGCDYFLVSNEISQTTRELKQSIAIVRWY